MSVAGLVLAAGAGSRYGVAKILAVGDDGVPWVQRAVIALRHAGCDPILVTVGAEGGAALSLLDESTGMGDVTAVLVDRWDDGISASISAGLAAAVELPAVEAVVIVPVDVPSLSTPMVRRVLGETGGVASALRQATFAGRPGHPVLVGREHWAQLRASLHGDLGARPYLIAHCVQEVDCSDLGSGEDVDRR